MSLIWVVVLSVFRSPLLTYDKFQVLWRQRRRGDMSLRVVTKRMSKAGAMGFLVPPVREVVQARFRLQTFDLEDLVSLSRSQ